MSLVRSTLIFAVIFGTGFLVLELTGASEWFGVALAVVAGFAAGAIDRRLEKN